MAVCWLFILHYVHFVLLSVFVWLSRVCGTEAEMNVIRRKSANIMHTCKTCKLLCLCLVIQKCGKTRVAYVIGRNFAIIRATKRYIFV